MSNFEHVQSLRNIESVNFPIETQPRMDKHVHNRPIKGDAAKVAMINLEADSFKLMESRIQFDLQVFRVARARLETDEGQLYHQTLQHRKHCYEVSASAAASFFDANVKIMCTNKANEVIQAFESFEANFCKNYGLQKDAVVPHSKQKARFSIFFGKALFFA